ncbi:MAG TPA: YpdA family putative bacillithiol disulfide reductase [Bacteroidota bacterium]|nr:YpdA family putative bacillithiol disulfide reductase [Bacteroidota bacterium]
MSHFFEVIIVGAGPAGLAVAIEAQKAGLSYCVIDKGAIVNSIQRFPRGMTFFSTPELLEIGGVPFTSAAMRPTRMEALEYYRRVADHYALTLRLYEEITTIERAGDLFAVHTTKNVALCRNLVLAAGFYDHPNRLGVKGEDLPHVSHYYDEPFAFYRRNVAIVGGKNSAAIAALELFRHGAHVTLIHRHGELDPGIKYWILPDLQNRIKEGSIHACFNSTVLEIRDNEILMCGEHGKESVIGADHVFVLIGYHPDNHLLVMCGAKIDEELQAPIVNMETYETSVARVYVAGSMVAGKNNNKVFIEDGRHHGRAIVDHILRSK